MVHESRNEARQILSKRFIFLVLRDERVDPWEVIFGELVVDIIKSIGDTIEIIRLFGFDLKVQTGTSENENDELGEVLSLLLFSVASLAGLIERINPVFKDGVESEIGREEGVWEGEQRCERAIVQ